MRVLINHKLFISINFFIVISLVYNNVYSEYDNLQLLQIGDRQIYVEIADTEEKIKHGLIYRQNLPENQGMLFVTSSEGIFYLWMNNVYIPLSVGFFNTERELLQVQEMQPDIPLIITSRRRLYQSPFPCKYALEMNKRWFRRNEIKKGTTLEFK